MRWRWTSRGSGVRVHPRTPLPRRTPLYSRAPRNPVRGVGGRVSAVRTKPRRNGQGTRRAEIGGGKVEGFGKGEERRGGVGDVDETSNTSQRSAQCPPRTRAHNSPRGAGVSVRGTRAQSALPVPIPNPFLPVADSFSRVEHASTSSFTPHPHVLPLPSHFLFLFLFPSLPLSRSLFLPSSLRLASFVLGAFNPPLRSSRCLALRTRQRTGRRGTGRGTPSQRRERCGCGPSWRRPWRAAGARRRPGRWSRPVAGRG